MDLEKVWKEGGGSDDELNKLLEQNKFDNIYSKSPLRKLKSNLLWGFVWAILITAGYIALFFVLTIWQVYVALVVAIIFNVWIMALSWRLYKSINEFVTTTNSLKEELQKNHDAFVKWWHIQEKAGLFVYPIAVIGGFITGGVLESGKSVEDFLYNPRMLLILGITILVFVPLCYYGARWMFKYAYGRHLKKIKLIIDELS